MEKVFVFGRGRYYRFKREAILSQYEIFAFLDNHVGDAEAEDGIEVYAPKELANLPPYKILVMTASQTFADMVHQLQELGIDDSRILIGVNMTPEFNECETLLRKIHGTICAMQGDGCRVTSDAGTQEFRTSQEFLHIMNRWYRQYNPYISWLANMPLQPLSRKFGRGRGTPIDRYYIESFLEEHRNVIRGDVYEVAEDTYTKAYGASDCVPHIIHVTGLRGMKKVDLATGEGVKEDMADCFICTQTLQMIYDVQGAAKNIYRMLKPNGMLLLTAHGTTPLSLSDAHAWGEYWHFTEQSLRRLFVEAGFSGQDVHVQAHGNIKTSMCFLYGMCAEDLDESDFSYQDEQFPMLLTAACKKCKNLD